MSLNKEQSRGRYLPALAGIALTTALLAPLHAEINTTTVALALLLVVLFAALFWGSGPALLASVSGMLCFNFFFLPPIGTFTIEDPQNWVALTAFLITAITVGELSARAKQRAEEAEEGQRQIERLYLELQEAFDKASQTEALRRSEKLKSALLDAVTHDIRTPLTSIKASVTTLLAELRGVADDVDQATLDAESRREMLEVIDEESDRLNRFVDSLIDLARIEAGELQLRRRWGPLDEIINMTLARAANLIRGHHVKLSVERGLPVVLVDPSAVGEVIYVLVDNAAKYSPAQSNIDITVHRIDEKTVEVAVEDEGPGIPAELRERVFDKFFRATRDGDTTGGSQPSGTGMGLAIAKGIVEAHDGQIRIEPAVGHWGTRVAFTLLVGDDEVALEEIETADAQENPTGSRPQLVERAKQC